MCLKSIRARMTVAFALTISLLMLLACGGLIWYAQAAAEHKADALLAATMVKIENDLKDSAPHIDASDVQDDARPSHMALWIGDPRGHTLVQSPGQIPSRPWRSDADWYIMVESFRAKTVVLGLPWHASLQALQYEAAFMIFLGVFVTVAATIGAWIVVGRTLSPIGDLSRQAQAASAENLHMRLDVPSQDAEITGLVSTLNGLLARISETVAAKGRFHAAASHELRTPLQVLSGQLELALRRERSNEEYRQSIHEARVYALRLTALVRDLLLLHQLDSAQLPMKADVDLVDLYERALDWLTPKIQERRLHIQRPMKNNTLLEAPPSHAEMLIRNLLENAVNYATPDGCIRINVCDCKGQMQLVISNDYREQAEGDLQKWLAPFQRRESAPQSSAGGTGLGLAICKAIADANGWTLEIHSEAGSVSASVHFSKCQSEKVSDGALTD